jgi:dTDP-4-amino-4,6-dideoxygalactose transaminase
MRINTTKCAESEKAPDNKTILPLYNSMTKEDIAYVISCLRDIQQ